MAFTIENGVLIKYIEENGTTEITIPDVVTEIGEEAFRGSSITSVYIPDSVKKIAENAFDGCSELISVRLSNQLEELESAAFVDCKKLTDIVIPESVKRIDGSVFDGCESLKSVTFLSDLECCSRSAFEETPWFKSHMQEKEFLIAGGILIACAPKSEVVIIPDGVTLIDEECNIPDTVRKIYFPKSIKGLSCHIFNYKISLEEVVFSEGITYIEQGCFSECENLKTVKFSNGLQRIDDFAFQNCKSLEKIILPDSVTEIGMDAFSGCDGVKMIRLPNNHVKIGQYAFFGISLDELYIPKGFTNGHSLTIGFLYNDVREIVISPENESLIMCDDILYSKDMTILFRAPENIEKIVIPDTVSEIAEYAFFECEQLREAVIPDSVKLIGRNAFQRCDSLEKIVIPDSVSEISLFTFSGCIKLKAVSLPKKLTSICAYAFAFTAIESIIIPEQVSLLGENAFECCQNLTEVKMPDNIMKIQAYEEWDSLMYRGENAFKRRTPLGIRSFNDCMSMCEDYCYWIYDAESKKQLLQYVFMETPWLKSQGYADDEG